MTIHREGFDAYLTAGCGRCDRFQTPDCHVHRWQEPLFALRTLLLETDLNEAIKWGSPCYTLDGHNVIMLGALKDHCTISFFNGAGLPDPDDLLEKPGPHTKVARLIRFRSLNDVHTHTNTLKALIHAAIAFERSGQKINVESIPEDIPPELSKRLNDDPKLAAAFDALTPGRKRSFYIHIGSAKQSKTRHRRIDKSIPKILAGKGFNEY